MPKVNASATRLVPKKFFDSRFFLALGLFGLFLVFISLPSNSKCDVVLGANCFDLEYADTPGERVKGLSGRKSLGAKNGMLFEFDEAAEQCMWMKDMGFSLDMVWLDEYKKIVKIAENVRPETFPKSFCADKPALYVIELNAGVVKQAGLETEQTLTF